MAETDPSTVDEVLKALKLLPELMDKASDSSASWEQKLVNLKRAIIDLGSAAGDVNEENKKSVETLVKVNETALGLIPGFRELATGMDRFAGTTKDANGAMMSTFTAFSALGSNIGKIASFSKEAGEAIGLFGKILSGLGENYAKAADNTRALENSFVALAGKSGGMGGLFKEGGSKLRDFDSQITKFVEKTYDLQKSTGITANEISRIQGQLGQIPGMLTSNIEGFGESMSSIEAVTKVMSATGRTIEEVYDDLNFAYETLGYGADKANESLKVISQMSSASETLGVRFEDVHNAVKAAGTAFQYLGDNTEAAVRVLGRVVPALQAVGASPKQAVEMINQMTSGIQHLDTASKAFINQRSGGMGGLQGAFQIDKLIKEGKYDEVLQKAQEAFKKQIGGRVVTLDEAANSPQAAAQYQRQLSFAKSGVFGQQVKDDQQAAKFFEAMSKGTFDTAAKQIIGRNGALNTNLERGENFQKRNRNALSALEADVRKLAQFAEMAMAGELRFRIGSESKYAGAIQETAREARAGVARSNALGEEINTNVALRTAKVELEAAGTVAKFAAAFSKPDVKPEHRPNQPNVALTTSQQDEPPPGTPGTSGQSPAPYIPLGAATPRTPRDARRHEAMARTFMNTQPQGPQTRLRVPAETAHVAAQARDKVADVKFPSKLALEGSLDVKCPNCGINNKAEIIADAKAAVHDHDAAAIYGVPNPARR